MAVFALRNQGVLIFRVLLLWTSFILSLFWSPVVNPPLLAICDPNAVMVRASVSSSGIQGSNESTEAVISGDGRWIAFKSPSSNLVFNDTNGVSDIFVYDRQTCITIRASVASNGAEANNWSQLPSISADGRFVAFESVASNLVGGDTNNAGDVFVRDLQTGLTTRVSVASDGTQANAGSSRAYISGDGRYVAFTSQATNLDGLPILGSVDVFVHDRQTGQTTRVSVSSSGLDSNNSAYSTAITADGRYVVFVSTASNLVSGDSNNDADVFVHDRQTATTTRVSVATGGIQGNGGSGNLAADISDDGRYVAFPSTASNLVSGDTNNMEDVFVHDRQTGETTRVSVTSSGNQGSTTSFYPVMSANGRFVAFSSFSSLVSDDTNSNFDIYVRDRWSSTTLRVSTAANGTQGNGSSSHPTISDDGRLVTLWSQASNLVTDDTNGHFDVFVTHLPLSTVNNPNNTNDGLCDSAHCNLREAILTANSRTGVHIIDFNLAGAGPHTIQPRDGGLPPITDPVIIDGTTQPGYAGTPRIVIDGSLAGLANGLWISGGNSTVRGLAIGNFVGAGILLDTGGNNVIEGNYIGTNAAGTAAQGNRDGVYIFNSANNRIGGTAMGTRNVISGNTDDGVNLEGSGSTGNQIHGNYIGTTASGYDALGNQGDGIKISATSSNNMIGWQLLNIIAFNVGRGIYIEGPGAGATGNAILSNSILLNGGQGIGLGNDGVTPNDHLDADAGPNNLQNYPELQRAVANVISTTITGTLNSAANTSYRIEFFQSASCDGAGYGEGESFLGATSVTTNGSGGASFTFTPPFTLNVGHKITATATNMVTNDTSEFSACVTVSPPSADLSVTQTDAPDPIAFGGQITYTITVTNHGPDALTTTTLTDDLPESNFVSATPTQGDCSQSAGIVTCNLGGIASGASATVTVVIQGGLGPSLANVVSVSGNLTDPNPANNSDTETTTILATATLTYTPSSTPTPLTATPTATNTLPPTPPAFVQATLAPSNSPVPPPTQTPSPIPTATHTAYLVATPTATPTPPPSPPPLGP
jgi:uncharacterized repeat protein (TIGR01451 family)